MANTSIEKTEAIQRFLGYAAEYLAEFSNAIDKTQALRFMEHFLIFLTAAVQNFKPKNMKAPSIDMFLADDKWHQVCWLWEARNTVAHDYMKFHTPDAVLEFGGYESAVFVSGFFFLDVSRYDSKKKEYEIISAPAENALQVCRNGLEFWNFVFRKIHATPTRARNFDLPTLWNNFNSR